MQQRRSFKHLSSEDIKGIIQMHMQEVPKLRIAEHYHIDNSTVHYHINKYTSSMGDIESGEFYSIMKVGIRAECKHPSLKCSCCGAYKDNMISEQNSKIMELEETLRQYKSMYGKLVV